MGIEFIGLASDQGNIIKPCWGELTSTPRFSSVNAVLFGMENIIGLTTLSGQTNGKTKTAQDITRAAIVTLFCLLYYSE